MKPVYLSIRQKETGDHIRTLMRDHGYTVRDIQEAMGFENPQAVYHWLNGRSLPSIDNLLILSRLLDAAMEDILVIDGDVLPDSVCSPLTRIKSRPYYDIYLVQRAGQSPYTDCMYT